MYLQWIDIRATSQAATVSNDCLNPILDSNTIDNVVGVGNCGGTVSQQDEVGSAGRRSRNYLWNNRLLEERLWDTIKWTDYGPWDYSMHIIGYIQIVAAVLALVGLD